MTSIQKYRARIAQHGILGTLRIAWAKSMSGKRRQKILQMENPEARFTEIFNSNHWNSTESLSGTGSTMDATASLRETLPSLFDRHHVAHVLDVPCGDYNWMQHVVAQTGISYTGGDIVRPLIERNQQKYGTDTVRFAHLDLTSDTLPVCDLLLCRDCLFHLCETDILKALDNLVASQVPLALITSNALPDGPRLKNTDITTGDMRPLDLFSEPYMVDAKEVEVVDDSDIDGTNPRCMVLMNKTQIAKMRDTLAAHLNK